MKHYIGYRYNGFQLKIARSLFDETFTRICCCGFSDKESVFKRVPSSKRTRVYYFEYGEQGYFCKVFIPRNWHEPIRNCFRKTRPERALRAWNFLREKGFCSPRIVLIGTKGPLQFMVTEAIKSARLETYFIDTFTPPLSTDKITLKRQIIFEIGHTIGRLHSHGIVHGDMAWRNIIIDDSDPCGRRLVFIDTERMTQYEQLPNNKRIKDIGMLNSSFRFAVTRTDRLRFLDAYLQDNPELISRKSYWIYHFVKETVKNDEIWNRDKTKKIGVHAAEGDAIFVRNIFDD